MKFLNLKSREKVRNVIKPPDIYICFSPYVDLWT